MGQTVPVPQTVFQAGAVGGVASIPTTSVTYEPIGVNLTFTPTVTYNDEVILTGMTLEKSGIGANLEVGGQTFPTFTKRTATQSTRLRDGESTLVAGLLLDEEEATARSVPGLSRIPLIRNILGGTTSRSNQTDVVMIITPRIVRGHGLTAEDVRPMYVGTGQNVTTSSTPQLLSPEALGLLPAGTPAPPPSTPAPSPAPGPPDVPPASPAAPIVPIEPAPQAAAPDVEGATRVLLTPPSAGPAGALVVGGGPYTMPIQITGAEDIATLSLTIAYNPTVVRDVSVTPGSFMSQGGAAGTFVPAVDAAAGRVDLVFSRPAGQGASGSGLLAALAFRAGEAGTTDMRLAGVATTVDGRSVPLSFTTTRLTVR
jgi:general secretion pathway protein D